MSGSKSKDTKKRLEILNNTNDGFKIASEDLKLLQYASEAAEWIMTNHQDWIQDLEKNEKNTSVIL